MLYLLPEIPVLHNILEKDDLDYIRHQVQALKHLLQFAPFKKIFSHLLFNLAK